MGRKPRQEPIKEYLENPRTTWLFSSPHEFRECFGDMGEKYITEAGKGKRLGKDTFRIILHLPNNKHNDRDNYINNPKKMEKGKNVGGIKGGNLDRFLPGGALEASRIRWDSGSYPSAQLVLHTKRGKRVTFFLGASRYNKGATVYGNATFPSPKTGKLVNCAVRVGHFGVSASKKGQYLLSLSKPRIECNKGLVAAGHAPAEFLKPEKKAKKGQKVSAAEGQDIWLSEEGHNSFYEAQGMSDLLEIQDVEIMDSETEQQAIERAYYNPSDAMVGTDETLDGYRPIDSATVDLTSNQPMANYGAEGETATYAPSDEPDMVSSSSFDEPTNSHFSAHSSCMCKPVCKCAESCRCAESYGAEGESVADVEATVEPANEPIAVAEGTSLDGYAPIDSIEEAAPIGHGVNQYFGSAETEFNTEGTEEALLDESTTNIGIEEGTSLDNFSGVDSVVVEAPLGHGVSQWYAEGEKGYTGPLPEEPAGITGQDGPSDTPSNEYMNLEAEFNAMDRATRKKVMKKYGRKAFVKPDELGWPIMNLKGNDEQALTALTFADWPQNKKMRSRVRKAVHKQFPSLASEHHKGQGYDDEMDESLGMRHRGGHEQSFKDRRDEASAMDKKGRMGRKYDDVMAMDAQGYDDKMDESLGMRHRGSHSQSFKDRRDEASAMDKKHGGRKYHDVGTMDKFNAEGFRQYHASARTGFVFPKREAWPIGNKEKAQDAVDYMERGWGDKAEYPKIRAALKKKWGDLTQFEAGSIVDWRDDNGQYKGGSSAHDKRGRFLTTKHADTAGYLQDGSLSMDGYTPLESVDVDRTSYQPTQTYGADGITSDHPFVPAVKTGAGIAVGLAIPGLLIGTAAMLAMGLFGNRGE